MTKLNSATKTGRRKALKPGAWRVGYEYAGCFNSGMRPKIWRGNGNYSHLYFVGTQSGIDISGVLLQKPVIDHWISCSHGRKPAKRIVKDNNANVIHIFVTAGSAFKKYEEMNAAIAEYNRKQAEEVAELRAKAKRGDIASIISLGLDY